MNPHDIDHTTAQKSTHKNKTQKLFKSAIIYIGLAIIVWLIVAMFSPRKSNEVASIVATTFAGVISIIVSVFFLIGLIQVWLSPAQISKVLGKEAGWKSLVLSAFLPMILGGSLFVIFPLLKTLREKGARTSSIVAFLFAWSAKAPLLPLEIKYLGLSFALLRLASIPVLAILGGLLAEWLIDKPERKSALP